MRQQHGLSAALTEMEEKSRCLEDYYECKDLCLREDADNHNVLSGECPC